MRKNKKILLALFLVCLTVLVIPFFDYGYIKANAANSGSYTYIVINEEAVIVDVDDAISGDIVTYSISKRTINLEVSDEVLAERRKKLEPYDCPVKTGWLARYAKLVGPVSDGAVLE